MFLLKFHYFTLIFKIYNNFNLIFIHSFLNLIYKFIYFKILNLEYFFKYYILNKYRMKDTK